MDDLTMPWEIVDDSEQEEGLAPLWPQPPGTREVIAGTELAAITYVLPNDDGTGWPPAVPPTEQGRRR